MSDSSVYLLIIGMLVLVLFAMAYRIYDVSQMLDRQQDNYWELINEYQSALRRMDDMRSEMSRLQDSHLYAVEREKLARQALQVVWSRWRMGVPAPAELPVDVDEILGWRPKDDSASAPSTGPPADDSYSWYGFS